MSKGKAKLFKSRKEIDGVFFRGKHGRLARQARKHKRAIEKSLRQKSRKLCKEY
jgi:hypothetical protein